jgi:prepilin-type N-terminal cleavage/methylation domain-containing protein
MTKRKGMTLIEILVLVAILGILASIILPSLARAGAAAGRVPEGAAGRSDDADSAAGSMTLIAIALIALLIVLNARRTGLAITVKDGKLDIGKRKG